MKYLHPQNMAQKIGHFSLTMNCKVAIITQLLRIYLNSNGSESSDALKKEVNLDENSFE